MTDDPLGEASDERYRVFIRNCSEGIWRLELQPPIDTRLPVDEQVELAYRNGRCAECNLAMARMYGLDSADDLVGKSLEIMLPASDPEARGLIAVDRPGRLPRDRPRVGRTGRARLSVATSPTA